MRLPSDRPVSLALSFALIRAATFIVPAAEQGAFERDWQYKLVHRWQFLRENGLWSRREEFRLLIGALAAISEASQHFAAQESVRGAVSRFVQSPFTCLTALIIALAIVGGVSGGWAATRDLFFKQVDSGQSKLVYVWTHNLHGGGDRPLPSDVLLAWKTHSHLLSGAAAFRAVHRDVQTNHDTLKRKLVVITEPDFFRVFGIAPVEGKLTNPSSDHVLLSYRMWTEQFRASPRVKDSKIIIAGKSYSILGILPDKFEPLSREAAFYLVEPHFLEQDAFAALKVNAGTTRSELDQEFTAIAQDVTYYFLNGQIRYGFARAALWEPVRSFGYALLAAIFMIHFVFRMKWRILLPSAKQGQAFSRHAGFFSIKATLALMIVFTACLEWSRSPSAILFGNFDPASGPFLLWLYILGTMGALFWAILDQKARCRNCQQLLAFPVRMGCPGSVLLDWSGTELCCTKGHGVLHIPHLAPSWAEESEHWITLDESWKSVFGNQRNSS